MSTKTKTETGPSAFARPHINQAISSTQNTVRNNQGNLDNISEQLRGAFGQAAKNFSDQSSVNNARSYNDDILSGGRLNSNPHLQGIIDQTGESVANRINSIFSRSGRTGSFGHGEGVGQGLADAENNLRFQDYSQERQFQENAANRVPSLEAARYIGLNDLNQTAANAAEIPFLGSNTLARNTQGLVGNFTSTTQKQGGLGSIAAPLISAGLSFLPVPKGGK